MRVRALLAAAIVVLVIPTTVMAVSARRTECYWDDPYDGNSSMHAEVRTAFVVAPTLAWILSTFAFGIHIAPGEPRGLRRYLLAAIPAAGVAVVGVVIAVLSIATTFHNYCD